MKRSLKAVEAKNPNEFEGISAIHELFENHTIEDVNKIIFNGDSTKPKGEYDILTKSNNKHTAWEVKKIIYDWTKNSDNVAKNLTTFKAHWKKVRKRGLVQINKHENIKANLVIIYTVFDINVVEVINKHNNLIAISINGNLIRIRANKIRKTGPSLIDYIIYWHVKNNIRYSFKYRENIKLLKSNLNLKYDISKEIFKKVNKEFIPEKQNKKEILIYNFWKKRDRDKYEKETNTNTI